MIKNWLNSGKCCNFSRAVESLKILRVYIIAAEPNVNNFAGANNDTDKDDADYSGPSNEPICFSRGILFDLIKDLNLSKESPELLTSCFNYKNLLHQETKIAFYCMCDAKRVPYFDKKHELVFFKDIEGALIQLEIENYVPEDWSLLVIALKEV